MYYERIRNLREDKELKQTDIAEVLGIKQQQYSRIETGVRNFVCFIIVHPNIFLAL